LSKNIYHYYLVDCEFLAISTQILGNNIHCSNVPNVKVTTCIGVLAVVHDPNGNYDQPCILTSYWVNDIPDTIQMTWSASTDWMQSGSSDIIF